MNNYTRAQLHSIETDMLNKLERAYECTKIPRCDTGKCTCESSSEWRNIYRWIGLAQRVTGELDRMHAEGLETVSLDLDLGLET